jgi:hypothetical protein
MTPRSPPRSLGPHCDRYGVTAATRPRHALQDLVSPVGVWSIPDIPVRPDRDSTKRHLGRAAPASSPDLARPDCSCGRPRAAIRTDLALSGEEIRDLRRPTAQLCRLRSGIHSFGRGPGVLCPAWVLERAQALHQLPSQPARRPGGGLRRVGHRRPARIRAEHRPAGTRVLRRRLLVLRQPGPGSVQAAHGSPGLLLGLLQAGEAGLTGSHSLAPRRAPRTPRAGAFSIPLNEEVPSEFDAIEQIQPERLGPWRLETLCAIASNAGTVSRPSVRLDRNRCRVAHPTGRKRSARSNADRVRAARDQSRNVSPAR